MKKTKTLRTALLCVILFALISIITLISATQTNAINILSIRNQDFINNTLYAKHSTLTSPIHPMENISLNIPKTISLNITQQQNKLDCKHFMTFYIRMYWGTFPWLKEWLLPSMELFFPVQLWNDRLSNQKCELLIVMDEESLKDRILEVKIQRLFPRSLRRIFDVRIAFEERFYKGQNGHDRQQWSMFYSDKYIKCSKYIAFLDTDISFKTIVLPSTLFGDPTHLNNPLVLGQPQSENEPFWSKISSNTKQWFLKSEPFRCMNYFPVILHTKHLKQLRETTLALQNETDFVNVLHKLGASHNNSSSQFNVFCAFIWYYKQNEYKFIVNKNKLQQIEFEDKRLCGYNYSIQHQYKPAMDALEYEYFVENYKNESLVSFEGGVQLTTHIKYITNNNGVNQTKNAVKFGYCFAINFKNDKYCKWHPTQMNKIEVHIGGNYGAAKLDLNCINLHLINPYLFEFEGRHSAVYQPNIQQTMQRHYVQIKQYLLNYNHSWSESLLQYFLC